MADEGSRPACAPRVWSSTSVSAPRIGDRVEVAYHAAHPEHFVYRPLVPSV
jgi:hypothetical protein